MPASASKIASLALLAFAAVSFGRADTTAANGNPGDWSDLLSNNPAPVTVHASGGPSGSGYTTLSNVPNEYGNGSQPGPPFGNGPAGYGSGPFSNYGASGPGYSISYPGAFYQSIDVYLDPSQTSGANSGQAFWIDMTPGPANDQLWGAENNFQVTSNGAGFNVTADGATTLATISNAGWYDFSMTFAPGATGASPVITTLDVSAVGGGLLGSTQTTAVDDGPGTFESSNLTGTGYVWFTVWNNGFLDDTVDVAEANTGSAAPDAAATLTLFAGAVAALGLLRRRGSRQ